MSFVLSLNFHRRHLTSGQKAAIAVDLEPLFAEEAKERQIKGGSENTRKSDITSGIFSGSNTPESDKGEARDKAAAAVGTNPRYVSDAKKLKKEAPEGDKLSLRACRDWQLRRNTFRRESIIPTRM